MKVITLALSVLCIVGSQPVFAQQTTKLTLAETAYESGTGTSLDVTDARRTLRQAQIDLATKRLEYQLATLELLRRVGQDMASL